MSIGWTSALVFAVCAVGWRAYEAPAGDAIAFLRVLVSAGSLAIFFTVRRYSMIRGLMLALAFEVLSGTALFALVDMPFVTRVAPELGRATAIALERGAPSVVHAIGMLAHP